MELNMVLINSLAQAFKGLLDAAKVEFNEENVVKILASVEQYATTPVSLEQTFDAVITAAEEIVKVTKTEDDDKLIEIIREIRDAQNNPDLGFGEKVGVAIRAFGDIMKLLKRDKDA